MEQNNELISGDAKLHVSEGTISRAEVEKLIEQKREQRKQLDKEIIELRKQWYLISDDTQWFTEEKEMVTIRDGKKKIKAEKLIGRIHWMEEFKDKSTGKPLILERSQVVTVDGKWEW